MRKLVFAVFAAALATGSASAAPHSGAMRCLRAVDIDHSHVVDTRNLLFYMRGGKVWHARLTSGCIGLNFHGYVMVGHPDEFCEGAQTLRVLQSNGICRIVSLTPYTGKPK